MMIVIMMMEIQMIQSATDLAIYKKVQKAFLQGFSRMALKMYFLASMMEMSTLRGAVAKEEDKNKIEKSVQAIDGVDDVNNRITVGDLTKKSNSQDSASVEDRQLNTIIRNRLRQWLSTKNIDALVIKEQSRASGPHRNSG